MQGQLEPDTQLQDRYRIVRMLGGGGMGQVYLAHDTRLADKPCAVKELIPDPHLSAEERAQSAAQFQREAAVLAHLNHSHLPNVSDYFEENGRFYLVMDYIEGETLEARLIASPGGLAQEDVVEWASQLCDVLGYLHSQDPPVIFRDMKPANVMITPEGQVKLIDFGVVRLFDPSKGTDTLKMGTAGYAPPEQYAGRGQTTPRSDVYALGATLYELLTGDDPTEHPFVFTPPRQLRPGVSQVLSDAVMRAVSMAPEGRFPSVEAMKAVLQKVTRPRRFRLPSVQLKRGTGTKAMAPAAVATPATAGAPTADALAARSRPAQIALGAGRWLLRASLTALIVLFIAALVFTLAGAFALSVVAENAIAAADWGWEYAERGEFVVAEAEVNDGIEAFVEPYALDAASSTWIDFRSPDKILVTVELASGEVTLQGRVKEQDGRPVLILEKLNDIPLYIVGGIVSGGVNRGVDKAWEDAPVRLVSISVGDSRLVYELR
jgi:tRNA A-37 threonylcarbamoyl transferase component Bud32